MSLSTVMFFNLSREIYFNRKSIYIDGIFLIKCLFSFLTVINPYSMLNSEVYAKIKRKEMTDEHKKGAPSV